MLGILFGIVCLIAFVKVARGRGYWRGHWRHGRGFGGYFLRRLFQRLNTGPGQEKLVLGELEQLRETAKSLRGELATTRGDLAGIVRDERFDRAKVDGLFRKQDELIGKLREALAGSLEKVHGALDEQQKKALADMVERGLYAGHGCGC